MTEHLRAAPHPVPALLVPALVLALASCGGTSGTHDDGESVDDLPPLHLTEELRVGHLDDPDLGFSRVGPVDVDAEGRLYVLEIMGRQIRSFDEAGTLLHRIGGPGEGPGEFGGSIHFGVRGDTLWTIDLQLQRITLFDLEGRVRSTARVDRIPIRLQPPQTSVGINFPSMMLPDGHFLGDVRMWMGGTAAPVPPAGPSLSATDTILIPRIRFAADGTVVDTAGWYPSLPAFPSPVEPIRIGGIDYRIPVPPRDRPGVVFLEDGHFWIEGAAPASARAAVFSVTRMGLRDDTVFHREYRYRPRDYGGRLDRIAWNAVRNPRGAYPIINGVPQLPDMPADSAVQFERVRARLDYPPFQPPIGQQIPASDGGLWLEREDEGGDERRWLLLDPVGEPRGYLTLPRETTIAWSGGDQLWLLELDEFEVPWLVRYRMTR